jgi:hypothetical protein
MQMKRERHWSSSLPLIVTLVLSSTLVFVSTPARADWLDALFGKSSSATRVAAQPGKTQRLWRLHEFTAVAIQPRETGSAPNQQPLAVQSEALRQQLAAVQTLAKGASMPLFASDELNELVGPLTQALQNAGPEDDVLLVSSAHREGGILAAPKAVTARLFVQGGSLQFIVHDARFDFYDTYRGTNVEPTFTYGSRAAGGGKPSTVVLQSASAAATRADWLAIPLSMQAPAVAIPAGSAGATAPAAPTSAAPAMTDAAGPENIERRLETLKRLRDRNLISEVEYQQKRKELLQLL